MAHSAEHDIQRLARNAIWDNYAEIWVKDNATNTILNSSAKVQITVFDTNGSSKGATPDHTNDHITVNTPGVYLALVSASIINVASQAHEIEVGLWKNNGATEFGNIHGHRNLAGGGGDKGSMSLSGYIGVNAGDTLELWADTDAAGDRVVTFEDISLSIKLVEGT